MRKYLKIVVALLLPFLFIIDGYSQVNGVGVGLRKKKTTPAPVEVAYYVSSSGLDSNTGLSPSSPIKTITKVNTLNLSGSIKKVYFKRGDEWSGTIITAYSGTSGNPVIYGAYGTGVSPVISGFTTVTGWTNYGDGIYYKVINPETAPNILTIDGIQYGMGRFPNDSNLIYESVSTNVSITDTELTGTPNWTGAEAVIYKNAYSIDRTTITNHTTSTLTYTSLGSTSSAEVAIGKYYFIQNDIRTLDQFGEWYYKSTGDTLFVYFGETDPTTVITKVSVFDNLIKSTGDYDYITVKNIDFEGSTMNAMYFSHATATNTLIDNCDIVHSGSGITIRGAYATVQNCLISKVNGASEISENRDGAIYLAGINNLIKGNIVSEIGLIPGQSKRFTFCIAITADGTNTVYENNIVNNVAYMGIYSFTNATNTLIQYNYIDSAAQLRQDAAAIYTGGTPNNNFRVMYNIITNSNGSGIYFDNYTQQSRAEGNTIYNSARNGMFINMGRNDTLKDNTVYKNGDGVNYAGVNLENWYDTDSLRDNRVTGNIVVSDTLQTNTQLINKVVTGDAVGFWGNNKYVMSAVDSTTFRRRIPSVSNVLHKFSAWKTAVASDYTSEALPLVYGNNVIFEYNTTTSNISVFIADSARDVSGNWYYNEYIIVEPFKSMVLFRKFTLPGSSVNIDSIYAAYPLNGNLQDSVASQDGTNFGAVVTTSGKFNAAYDFESNDKISFPINTAVLNNLNYSVSLWFKIDILPSVAGRQYKIFYDVQTPVSFKVDCNITTGNTINLTTRNTVPSGFTSNSVAGAISQTGVWYHLVINIPKVGGGAGQIFINGERSIGVTNTVMTGTDKVSNDKFYLGEYSVSPTYTLDGQIDDFVIRNCWTTEAEAAYIYNLGTGRYYPSFN